MSSKILQRGGKSLFPLIALCVWIISGQTSSAEPPTIEWIRPERGIAIAIDGSDQVYTIDYDYNLGGDIYLNKFSPAGDSLWTVKYEQNDFTRFDQAVWVDTDNDGNILIAGTSKSGYSNPVNAASILMKFNSEGQFLWRKMFEGTFDGSYTKKCLVDAQNNIYVLGIGDGPIGKTTKIKKFKPDGSTAWIYNDTTGIGAPLNFKFTPDNAIVISARGLVGSINGYAKIDTSGKELWTFPSILSITAGDIAGDEDGNSYIINDDYNTPEGSIIQKLSPIGEELWKADAPLAGSRVEVGSDQHPVVSGFQGSGKPGVAMMKWNAEGQEVWRNLNADSSKGLLLHAMMKIDRDNNIYVGAGTLFDMALCKVNSNGSSAWTLTTPGSYTNSFVLNDQSSIFWVGGRTVRVNQKAIYRQEPVICQGERFVVGSNTYTESGTYIDTLINASGGDSILTTVLTVNPRFNISKAFTICNGDSVVIGSSVYFEAGVYVDSLLTVSGCDSILTTSIGILDSDPLELTRTICEGESVTIDGTAYSETGVYTITLTSEGGCDSIVELTLTVLPPASAAQSFSICEGESITVGSNQYTVAGVYTDVFIGSNGCDSTLTTTIEVNPIPAAPEAGSNSPVLAGTAINLTATEVEGATYFWTGPNGYASSDQNPTIDPAGLDDAGEYSVTVTVDGCEGEAATILVEVNDTTPTSIQVLELKNIYDAIIAPNPFRYYTQLAFTLHEGARCVISVTDLAGREISKAIYFAGHGKNVVTVGENLVSGTYLLSIDTGKEMLTMKMMVLK
jgi:hypothetical protein